MSLHLQRDLDKLRKDILELGDLVESTINQAILMLTEQRIQYSEGILSQEKLINNKEVQIEEFCLKILALHQPMAIDLRFIVVVLKVNNDLERMGDFAENIAKRALFLSKNKPIHFPLELSDVMTKNIKTMVRNSIDSLITLDVGLARSVMAMDDSVDIANKKMYSDLQEMMESNSSTIGSAVSLLSCSRYLERIADLATNIAEDVIFMVDGEVIRHQEN